MEHAATCRAARLAWRFQTGTTLPFCDEPPTRTVLLQIEVPGMRVDCLAEFCASHADIARKSKNHVDTFLIDRTATTQPERAT